MSSCLGTATCFAAGLSAIGSGLNGVSPNRRRPTGEPGSKGLLLAPVSSALHGSGSNGVSFPKAALTSSPSTAGSNGSTAAAELSAALHGSGSNGVSFSNELLLRGDTGWASVFAALHGSGSNGVSLSKGALASSPSTAG